MNLSNTARTARRRAKAARGSLAFTDAARISAKVGITDQDVFGHMTNTRYNAFAEIALDSLLIRSGADTALKDRGAGFSISGEATAFARLLRYPDRFDIEIQLSAWTGGEMVFEYVFSKGGKQAAQGVLNATLTGADVETMTHLRHDLGLAGATAP